jgi:N-methylhydantoinase B
VEVNDGDVIRVVTGNGGGCGDAKKRAPQDIARDLKNGYLTPERAREIYGYEG